MNGQTNEHSASGLKSRIGLIAGVIAATVVLSLDLDPANPAVTRTAAVAVLMAIWWITEAIPIPATALIPVALFPLLGVMNGKAVAATYFNNVIFLFIGGFIVALAMQRWHLHRRIALRIIMLIGASPRRLMLGFMLATAFLSMWISNTATAMMMLPIALAVIFKLRESQPGAAVNRLAIGLLLGIAYAASIGGIATLIGTPPNLAFNRIFHTTFPAAPEITFADWFVFGLPTTLVLLTAAWLLLTLMYAPHRGTLAPDLALFRKEYARLGKMSYEEKLVLVHFAVLAFLWLFRKSITVGSFAIPGWSEIFGNAAFIDDGTVAMMIALLLFVVPSRSERGERLMNWRTAVKLNWGIVILFGGGFALAAGFKESGLSAWLAQQLTGLAGVPQIGMVASVSTLLTFLTELTSNTATTQIVLPLLGALAKAIRVNPLLLMIPATLSASCAFMLPVATPPNAIVFGSGEVKMGDMMRVGIILNLLGVVLITALVYLVGLAAFGIDPGQFPAWAE